MHPPPLTSSGGIKSMKGVPHPFIIEASFWNRNLPMVLDWGKGDFGGEYLLRV